MAEKEDFAVFTISYCQTAEPLLYELNEKITNIPLYSQMYSMKKAILFKHAIRKLKKALQDYKIDILVACGALFYPLAIQAAKHGRTKCICWEHSNANNKHDHKFQTMCRKYGAKHADAIVTLTQKDKELYRQKYHPPKLCQIYNPLDPDLPIKAPQKSSTKKIISVGRLCYQKNYPLLLAIAKEVLQKNEGWQWDIYGEGPDRAEIERIIADYGLEQKVILKGQDPDLYDKYGQYAFLVMTSRYEGFSMALLEATGNGLPLIAFDVYCGPGEIIRDGYNGYLIKAFDKEDMIEKIDCLCKSNNKRLAMVQNALSMSSLFLIEPILSRWQQLFSGLLSN